jgi:hypothetical protein
MFVTAIDLLKAQKKTPAINIKVILDGEEEIRRPTVKNWQTQATTKRHCASGAASLRPPWVRKRPISFQAKQSPR